MSGIIAKILNTVAIKGNGSIIFIMNIEDILKSYKATPQVIDTVISIRDRFKDSGLNVENVSLALLQVMMEIDKIKKLKPSERKDLIIKILNKIVEEVCPGDDTHLEAVLKQMIPNLIDSLNDIKLEFKMEWCACLKNCMR
jgi:hypothetical protein